MGSRGATTALQRHYDGATAAIAALRRRYSGDRGAKAANGRVAFVAGFAVATLLYLFPACGGGNTSPSVSAPIPPPTIVLPTQRITDFVTVFDGSGSAEAVVFETRVHYWNYTWTKGRQHNGGDVGSENGHIATCENGEQWQWLDGYSSGPPGSLPGSLWPTWPVDTVKADWTNLDTGAVRDLTGLCGQKAAGGQPYILYELPQSGHYRIRVWGWIWGAPPPEGKRERPYYWQSDFAFGGSEVNPCWLGEAPSTRPVIVQKEVWWDPAAGWVRGVTMHDPWNGSVPAEPGPAAYKTVASIAAGAGILWNLTDENGAHVCLQLVTRS